MHIFDQCLTEDRAAVLEDSFDRVGVKDPTNESRDLYRYLRRTWDLRSSENAALRARAQLVPLVIDNSTVTGGKTRAVTSAAQLSDWPSGEMSELGPHHAVDLRPLAGTPEVRATLCSDNDLRLSTAALLASRFPYVNPAGRLQGGCAPYGDSAAPESAGRTCANAGSACNMELVDGGYTDNSGLFTLEGLLPAIRALAAQWNSAHTTRRPIAIVLLELDNHYRPTVNQPPPATGGANQSTVPLATIIGGHSAIETYARSDAYRAVNFRCTVTISPGLHPGVNAPVGWELSTSARGELRDGLVRRRANQNEQVQLQTYNLVRRVQGWLTEPPEGGDETDLRLCVPAGSEHRSKK